MDYQKLTEYTFEITDFDGVELTQEVVDEYKKRVALDEYKKRVALKDDCPISKYIRPELRFIMTSREKAFLIVTDGFKVCDHRRPIKINERFIVTTQILDPSRHYDVKWNEFRLAKKRFEQFNNRGYYPASGEGYAPAELRDLGIECWEPLIVETYIQYGGSIGSKVIYHLKGYMHA